MFSTCKGYSTAFKHHMGTLAFGSFICGIFRFIQVVLGAIAKSAEGTGNDAAACLAKICACIVACFHNCIEHLNKNAYMDTALNGNGFCTAAYHAMQVLTSQATSVLLLHGVTWIFDIAALGGISASGAFLTFFMLKALPQYNTESSSTYLPDPLYPCITSGVICFMLVLPFVQIFGHTADTILFCFAVDKKRNPHGYSDAKSLLEAPSHMLGGALSWFPHCFGRDEKTDGKTGGGRKINILEMAKHPPDTEALLKAVK